MLANESACLILTCQTMNDADSFVCAYKCKVKFAELLVSPTIYVFKTGMLISIKKVCCSTYSGLFPGWIGFLIGTVLGTSSQLRDRERDRPFAGSRGGRSR